MTSCMLQHPVVQSFTIAVSSVVLAGFPTALGGRMTWREYGGMLKPIVDFIKRMLS